jgi:DNA-binding transcriptional ArsR family regulator
MASITAFAETAALIGDPARANMLTALMDGRALTATELARAASIAPQTASGHLTRLVGAGLLAVERQGRHRYHRLASPGVARMLEGVMAVAETNAATRLVVGPRDQAMRAARTCYDHLAGRLAVDLADAMVARGQIEFSAEGGAVTQAGKNFLEGLGVELKTARPGRVFCRPCLDWSERRPHLAGAVGAALCARCLALGWVRRIDGTRALHITPEGRRGLRNAFGVAG